MKDICVTAVDGNRQRLDGGAMFGNAPRSVWEGWITPDSQGRIPLNCRAMLIESDGRRILCETGIGNFFDPKMADRYGVFETEHMLLKNLSLLGVNEDSIDFVILSHLHFDHAGGLLNSWEDQQTDGKKLCFPNAKYVVSREALSRAKTPHPRDRASFIQDLQPLLESSGRLVVVDSTNHPEVLPETLSFYFSHGHTPGHMHTIVNSNKSRIVFAGDLIPGRAWVHLPITMGYDRFAELVIDEKKAFYDKFSDDKTWVFFTHDHQVSMSHIHLSAKGRFESHDNIEKPIRFAI